MNEKLVIFDLDGVIVETSKNHYLAWKKITNELGYDLSEQDNDLLKGISRKESLLKIFEIKNIKNIPESQIDILLEKKNNLYIESLDNLNENSSFKYIKELFELLNSNNIKIAIASASKNAKFILQKLNLLNKIDFISDPNKSLSKPDPGIFLQAFNYFNFKKEEVIGVEDSQAGIDALNSIDIKSIGINNNNLKNCKLHFSNIKELYDYLIKE